MIYFDKRESNSIKSIVVNSSTMVDVSTRFCKGKMLMFAKMSLKLFVQMRQIFFVFLMIKSRVFLIKTTLQNVFYILIKPTLTVAQCLFSFVNLNVVFHKVFLEMCYLKFLSIQKLVQGWTFVTIFGNSLTCRIKEREKLWDFMKLKTSIMQISVKLQ